jgi:hypothetical protein
VRHEPAGSAFGGDLGAFALATGVPQQQVDAIVRGRGNAPSRLSRADLYLDDTGFRVLELNMSAALGGIDSGGLIRAYLDQPFMAEFIAEHNLGYVDTMVEVAQTLLAECTTGPGVRPTVAFCDWPASYPELEPHGCWCGAPFSALVATPACTCAAARPRPRTRC